MPAFQLKFFPGVYAAEHGGYVVADPVKAAYCKYNDQVLQLVVSSLYIAALFAGLVASKFARLYGRKASVSYVHTIFGLDTDVSCVICVFDLGHFVKGRPLCTACFV